MPQPPPDPWQHRPGWEWGASEANAVSVAANAAALERRRGKQQRQRRIERSIRFAAVFVIVTPLVAVGVYKLRETAENSAFTGHFDNAAVQHFVPEGAADTDSGGWQRPGDYPPVPADARPSPLGQVRLSGAGSGSYSFIHLQPDGSTPVTYDPCRPIHYSVRRANEPPFGEEILTQAIDRVSAATGLVFVRDADTDELPSFDRGLVQRGRYGNRWVPLLVAWSSPAEVAELGGGVVGLGGSRAVANSFGTGTFVSGVLVLDAPQMREVAARPRGVELDRAIILHELGHVVGLGHVNDRSEIMAPETNSGVTDYRSGDLTGLAKLGQGPCNSGT